MTPIDVVYDICRYYISDLSVTGVDSALLKRVDGYRRARNLAELSSCSRHFDQHLHTIKEWEALRQIEAFFKKNALFANRSVCFDSARRKFFENEAICSETNRRLKDVVGYPNLIEEGYRHYINRMARYISNVLGDFSPFLKQIPALVKVTPGATSTQSRRGSLPQNKMRLKLWATRPSHKYLDSVYRIYGFSNLRLRETVRNRVELVPKNWKTDRTIACEPEGNIPLQLAFDTYVKSRLRRFGINLRDQSANQRLAKHASIHDDFVTVDFSSASDTISYNVVHLLFPVDWFSFLRDVRTPGYRGVFGSGTYAKFSSMGNGTTFCIETLIFAAACHAVGSKDFLVYGDDVIIEKEFYQAYLALTRFLGFTINEDKSFHDGPFRESCGGDYFNGVDVTPVYIRSLDARKASYCHLVNSLMRITLIGGTLRDYLASLVKSEKLPLVPINESTMSGVWIDPGVAREQGILVTKHYIPKYKAYTPKCKSLMFRDIRGYYLWFLRKVAFVNFSRPWEAPSSVIEWDQTSSAPAFDHKYVRKWVVWVKPDTGKLDQILFWSEQLIRERNLLS